MYKKLLVFASGSKDGGGSGFEKLCQNVDNGTLRATIVGVVSNHPSGGVYAIAKKYGVRFIHMGKPYTAEAYQEIVADTQPDFIALSGWVRLVEELDPRITFNIHPAPLPAFGGKGMYGIHAHEKVIEAYKAGRITHTAIHMHFVDHLFDNGPSAFSIQILLQPEDTAETLQKRVNVIEHEWQSKITDMIINGETYWDGKDPASLVGAIHI